MQQYVTFLTGKDNPTDDELLLELVLRIGSALKNPQEVGSLYMTSYGITHNHIQRLMELLIERCNLPVPVARAKEFIHWHQTQEALSTITKLDEDKRCSKS